MAKKKILILGNSHLVVFKFRGELIERLIKEGHEVWVSFPNGPFGVGEEAARQYGCHFVEIPMERRGTNPFHDLKLMKQYASLIRKVRPHVVLAYTVKPDVYGGIVCRLFGVPFIPNITGLGKGLAEGGVTGKITAFLYRLAVKKAVCVFFQNTSDKEFFDIHKIACKKGKVLPGSGVNLEQFSPMEYPPDGEPVRFIYASRIMKTKGIEEYLEASRSLKSRYPETEFHICGYCEEDYRSILKERVDKGEIIYHGLVEDVQAYEKDCHCIVLPSFHPEGISNVLLEGAAGARPLITTDQPGCRETVEDGVTGYLIRKRDSEDLIEKMLRFMSLSNEERRLMGQKGREKISSEFDRNRIVEAYMAEIDSIGAPGQRLRNKTRLEKAIQTPGRALMNVIYRIPLLPRLISDEVYVKLIYSLCFWKKLDLKHPETFTEKLQWMKLYDRREIYTRMVDKEAVKKYVSDRIGEEYVIPTIGLWEKAEDIDFDALPRQFVLKCTHDSGGLVICRDKGTLDVHKAKRKLKRCLKRNYYYLGREWPYKDVPPRILAEPYMADRKGEMKDYKFFCFSGIPRMLYIASDRQTDVKFDFFDMDFNHLPFINGHINSEKKLEPPEQFEKMKELAGKLSEGFPELRVDFYEVDGRLYFGELTLFHLSGFVPFEPEQWDRILGSWMTLPEIQKGGVL